MHVTAQCHNAFFIKNSIPLFSNLLGSYSLTPGLCPQGPGVAGLDKAKMLGVQAVVMPSEQLNVLATDTPVVEELPVEEKVEKKSTKKATKKKIPPKK